MRSLQEALRLSLAERRTEYEALNIDKVKIDGNVFDNYGVYSFVWEKSYIEEPTRSSSGAIDNLNSYVTFITGHFKINFSIMPIDYYRKLMQLIYSKNEFVVECYDVVYNKVVEQKMYFKTEELPTLWTIAHKVQGTRDEWETWIELAGVQDYTVEMVSTNADMDYVSVMYYRNSPTNEYDTDFRAEENVLVGSLVQIGTAATDFTDAEIGNYVFSHWNTQKDGKGRNVTNNAIETINKDGLILYAQWQESNLHTLAYNYGLATVQTYVDSTTGVLTERYSDTVQYGQSIGTLPTFTTPKVTIDNVDYYPYENGGWYKLPIKDNDIKVKDNELYWIDRDYTIYLLFDTKKYSVSYNTNTVEYTIPTQSVQYGTEILLPTLAKSGYTFDGWFSDVSLKTKVSSGTTMPPKDLNLYAKWTKN